MRNGWWLGMVRILMASGLFVLLSAGFVLGADTSEGAEEFLELSLEDLMDIEVTSVSKRAQPLHDAAAAIFVITNEDMEQQGVTNIADALRQVPGIHVGRIDSNKWAVTSRGFNGRFSNKLLVLIDGRSVYTPSFSGVYWEIQDMMLEDIDRIEVIRGPGSTLWGANAVNGVINIITKHAADTQGGLLVAGAGNVEKGFGSLRWGEQLSEGTFVRFYGKANARSEFSFPDSGEANDDWNMFRSGFRLDSQPSATETRTLQGDIYTGTIQQQATFAQLSPPYVVDNTDHVSVSGGNLVGRWAQALSPTSGTSLQVSFDRFSRDEASAYQATTQLDYDFQHHFAAKRQQIVWGLGYRYSSSVILPRVADFRANENRSSSLLSAFAQDEIALYENRLALIIGSKIEHNDYTGIEIQPSARLLWRIDETHRLWTSASRAVRTPMRAEGEFEVLLQVVPPFTPQNQSPLPIGIFMREADYVEAEELVAYEAGYRFVRPSISADIAAFYNKYTGLTTPRLGTPELHEPSNPMYVALPLVYGNFDDVADYGLEVAVAWQPAQWLRWNLAYSYLKNDSESVDGMPRPELYSPEHIAALNFVIHPMSRVNLNVGVRHTDKTMARMGTSSGGTEIPAYTTFDVCLGWQLHEDIVLSLVGQNLLEKDHLEFTAESFSIMTEVPRGFYAKIKWAF